MKRLVYSIPIIAFALTAYFYSPVINMDKLKEKYSDEHSHFLPLANNAEIHFKDKGEGEPIVLIHGTSASLHTWEKWEEELSKTYRTISIDMPGGGLTYYPKDRWLQMDMYQYVIEDVANHLGLDSFYLAGNSLGGHIAWEYAANEEFGHKVKKLILVDPSGFIVEDKPLPLAFRLGQSEFLKSISEGMNFRPFVKKSLKEVYYNDDLVTKELVDRYTELGRRAGNREGFFTKVQQFEFGKREDLQKIACPTLIQWGREDLWIPIELADIFTANIPDNELIVYDKCGHVPMEEIPLKSVQDVIEFIKD